MDALMNTVAYQSISMKADTLEQAYSTRLAKEAMTMDAKMALNELEMLPQVPKGQYVDVYA
ncbi:MAG: hypothetical protein IKO14_09015 [Oscillibacter sp.]|nr:hypothetical protein [Oscillibacter sp.]